MCKQRLSCSDINLADAFLLQFCKKVEHLFQKSAITPNMHMHAHLKDVILDFGPLQEFWCYAFERFNGILGKQPSNNRAIEAQLMNRFLRDSLTSSINYPKTFEDEFRDIMDLATSQKVVESVSDYDVTNKYSHVLSSKYSRAVLIPRDIEAIRLLLQRLNPMEIAEESDIHVNTIYFKYPYIVMGTKMYASSGKSKKPVVTFASWDVSIYGSPPTTLPNSTDLNKNCRPVNIHHFIKVLYTIGEAESTNYKEEVLAFVSWFYPHPERYALGKPAEIWCNSMFESFGPHSFLPLKNILSRCGHGTKVHNDESVIVVVPLVE